MTSQTYIRFIDSLKMIRLQDFLRLYYTMVEENIL